MPTTVNDLFDVRYGQSLELNSLRRTTSDLGIAFVSRKMGDNGVSAFVEPIKGMEPANAGELSVALGGNGVLTTFLQERPFYTGRDVAILRARGTMTRTVLLYYCMCIKANRYRYSYGRQANRSLARLVVPSVTEIPDWVSTANPDMYEGSDRPRLNCTVTLPDPSLWKPFRLGDLFTLKKGKRLTKVKMIPGATPFIGAIDNNNGVSAFVGQAPIHEGNTITVNYNGSVGEAFYQPAPFWATDDANVLYPKFAMTPEVALFVCTVIRMEKYRFNYGRKWHLERMTDSVIRLPSDKNGKPDLALMTTFIRTRKFSSVMSDDIAQQSPAPLRLARAGRAEGEA